MKTEPSAQPRANEAPADEASAQAAVQVALDRRDNGGRTGGGTEHDR